MEKRKDPQIVLKETGEEIWRYLLQKETEISLILPKYSDYERSKLHKLIDSIRRSKRAINLCIEDIRRNCIK